MVFSNGLSALGPWVLKLGIDSLEGLGSRPVSHWAAFLVAIAAADGFFRWIMRRTVIGVSRRVEYDIRRRLFEHLQRLPTGFFERFEVGDLMARVTNDINNVRMFLGPGLMYTVNTVLVLSFSVACDAADLSRVGVRRAASASPHRDHGLPGDAPGARPRPPRAGGVRGAEHPRAGEPRGDPRREDVRAGGKPGLPLRRGLQRVPRAKHGAGPHPACVLPGDDRVRGSRRGAGAVARRRDGHARRDHARRLRRVHRLPGAPHVADGRAGMDDQPLPARGCILGTARGPLHRGRRAARGRRNRPVRVRTDPLLRRPPGQGPAARS